MAFRANKSPLVSIIVPIYGVEKYLRECINSLLAQTYPNIEIILVDDGSPDGCGAICDEYAERDSRVVSLHKENGGLSDARNFGLRHANGELISFVDSDDWVSPIFIEALFCAMQTHKTKIAALPGGHNFHDGDDFSLVDDMSAVAPLMQEPLPASEALRLILYQALAMGAQWRLYEREVLGEDPFPVGLYYEDSATTYKFVLRADNIAIVDTRELYAYRLRPTGIVRQAYSPIKFRSAIVVTNQLYHDIAERCPDLAPAVSSRCFSICRMVFAQILTDAAATAETTRAKAELWAVLKRHRAVIVCDPHARKRERLAAGIACLGRVPFNLFCKAARKVGLLR